MQYQTQLHPIIFIKADVEVFNMTFNKLNYLSIIFVLCIIYSSNAYSSPEHQTNNSIFLVIGKVYNERIINWINNSGKP